MANDLAELTDHFAAVLAEEGVGGHFVIDDAGAADQPLFGDSPALIADRGAPAWEIRVKGALGEEATILLAVPERLIDDATMARLRGFAALYVGRGLALHEKASDLATGCPLTLCERLILGRLLLGEPLADVAARVGRSIGAVRSHVADAAAKLGADDRNAAVALAARRGWLLTMVNEV